MPKLVSSAHRVSDFPKVLIPNTFTYDLPKVLIPTRSPTTSEEKFNWKTSDGLYPEYVHM